MPQEDLSFAIRIAVDENTRITCEQNGEILPDLSLSPGPIVSPIEEQDNILRLSPGLAKLHNSLIGSAVEAQAMYAIFATSLICMLCKDHEFASSCLKVDVPEVIQVKQGKDGLYKAGFASLLFSAKDYNVVNNFVNPKFEGRELDDKVRNRILGSVKHTASASAKAVNKVNEADSGKNSGEPISPAAGSVPAAENFGKKRSSIGAFTM